MWSTTTQMTPVPTISRDHRMPLIPSSAPSLLILSRAFLRVGEGDPHFRTGSAAAPSTAWWQTPCRRGLAAGRYRVDEPFAVEVVVTRAAGADLHRGAEKRNARIEFGRAGQPCRGVT